MLVKRTSKNQLTLPKEIADAFRDTQYFNVTQESHKIILEPVKIVMSERTIESIRNKIKKLGITEEDINHAIQWARKNRFESF
ncbi:MAG: AbrB/MazE/SpoVT family DNA-binding domain-containing protein [Candidatus Eremiobacteraeota bacterium]|nr:AbrB/MazE/SpoVT family DNA-binding domain-containing protein [Candidatus Eremiobacteraeota bacterium]MCL5056074.1 AbrB/MazE/SpoVT family DNA-binding domain-containing protein [Bacillota bacterium]